MTDEHRPTDREYYEMMRKLARDLGLPEEQFQQLAKQAGVPPHIRDSHRSQPWPQDVPEHDVVKKTRADGNVAESRVFSLPLSQAGARSIESGAFIRTLTSMKPDDVMMTMLSVQLADPAGNIHRRGGACAVRRTTPEEEVDTGKYSWFIEWEANYHDGFHDTVVDLLLELGRAGVLPHAYWILVPGGAANNDPDGTMPEPVQWAATIMEELLQQAADAQKHGAEAMLGPQL